MTLRLSPEQDRALTELARAQRVSKQEAAVRAILETAERTVRPARVAGLSAQARDRYADLLERLGQ